MIRQISMRHSLIIMSCPPSLKTDSSADARLKLSKEPMPPDTKNTKSPPDIVSFGFLAFLTIQTQEPNAISIDIAQSPIYNKALSGLNRLMIKPLLVSTCSTY